MKKVIAPRWDLSDLYSSPKDPKIKRDKNDIDKKIELLSKNFKKNSFEENLKRYEKISSSLCLLGDYAFLVYSTNTKDAEISSFYQNINEYTAECSSKLLWFEIYLIKSNNVVKGYEHYLKRLRALKPYTLDEEKEVILTKKNQTGAESFIRFYDQIDSNKDFKGKTYAELSTIFSNDQDRKKREKAGKAISDNLESNSSLYTFILNTLLLDKKVDDEIRGYEYPQQATLLSYGIDKKVVDTMVSTITKNYKISERYYSAKSKLLGQKLHEWDRYNDIYPNIKIKVDWNSAKDIVLDSFKSFSNTFYHEAKNFFDKKWIDALPVKGKRSGAYCDYTNNSNHPYVFMNFTGELRDIETLAHELGHAIHGILSGKNTYFQFRPSTATAEIASIFAESLVFDSLYKKAMTKKEKINLLGNKIQGSFATVFRQNAFYLFESKIHELRRTQGELSDKTINDLYQEYLQQMFGKGLTLTDKHKTMWMPVAHFYHYNFYVFTYSFGELLTTSLYAIYKKDGEAFTKKYLNALSLGSSKSPSEIVKEMGIDITKEDFWQSGLDLINEQVKEFEKLIY
jgi:oligoendopeptidase F